MRFMIIVKATKDTEAGVMPKPEDGMMEEMADYHEDLAKAGVLLDASGLHPTSKGFRVRYSGDRRSVVDGPFGESKELIGGFSILQMRSLDEVVEWTDRYARILGGNVEVDVRPIAEPAAAEAQ